MGKLVKNLENGRKVIFDKGKFDDWCVYVVETNGMHNAPFDNTYFTDLKQISKFYPTDKVYNDFVQVYELTSAQIESTVLNKIDELVDTYRDEHKVIIEQWLTGLYAGMVAEENKQNTILKKRIKSLGMHQLLIEGMEPRLAANFSRGKKWFVLDKIMKERGF